MIPAARVPERAPARAPADAPRASALDRAPALRRVVVGVDFRASSAAAARWAAQHFAPEAELVLVHVVPDRSLRPSMAQVHWLRALRRSLGGLRDPRRVRVRLAWGEPSVQLARAAAEHDADVVVVGAHEERAGRAAHRARGALGSTAERVMRCSPVPVVLAAGALDAAPRVMLVPVDSRDVAPAVLEWVHWLADRFDASVAAVHLEHPTPRRRTLTADAADAEEALRAPEPERWRRLALADRPHPFLCDAVPGTLDRAVLHEAARFHAGLVVLRGAAGRAVGRVLRKAGCAVMVVPDR